jgi:hypothetical protein
LPFLVVYALVSIAVAGVALFRAGWGIGLSIVAGSLLALIAGGGLKASLLWGDRTQKIGGTVIAIVLRGAAQWAAQRFSIWIGSREVAGDLWCWGGFAVGLLFITSRRTAGMGHP